MPFSRPALPSVAAEQFNRWRDVPKRSIRATDRVFTHLLTRLNETNRRRAESHGMETDLEGDSGGTSFSLSHLRRLFGAGFFCAFSTARVTTLSTSARYPASNSLVEASKRITNTGCVLDARTKPHPSGKMT